MNDRLKIFEKALLLDGVPASLAEEAAKILVKDDPSKPDLGRTEKEKQIIQRAWNCANSKN